MTRVDAGLAVMVHMRPGARRAGVGGEYDGCLVVRVTAPPEGGRANRAVCDAVASALGVPVSAVEVARGARSRRKQLRVRGDAVALAARVEALRAGPAT